MLAADTALPSRTLRQRVGGAWSVAWPTFLITAGLSIFALLMTEKGASTSTTPALAWLVAWLCALVALVVLFVILRHTVFRNRLTRPLPVAVVVVKDILFTAIYTTVLVTVGGVLGVSLAAEFTTQLLSNALIGMWWGLSLAYFMDYRQQVREARSELNASGRTLADLDHQQVEIADRIRDDLLAEVAVEVGPLREHLAQVDAHRRATARSDEQISREEWQRLSEMLRQTAQESVRPLSHRLWQRAEQRFEVPPWWMLPSAIVRNQPFRPILFALIGIVGTLESSLQQYGGSRGSSLVFVGLALSIPVMLMANLLMRRHPGAHATIFLIGLALLQFPVIVRGYLRDLWIPGSGSVAWQLSQMAAVVVVVLVTSGLGAWRHREAAQLANLRAVVDEEGEVARVRSAQIAILARETAQYLHGSLQTRLIGCSLAMEKASASGDVAALERALSEALAALNTQATPVSAVQSVRDEVERKVDLWGGFCEFEIVIDDDEAATPDEAVIVGRVVEETLSNAIRHGSASRIEVNVTRDSSDLLLVSVTDNGAGPQGGRPGLGYAYLSMVSDGTWSINASDDSTCVTVPIAAPAGR